MHIFEHATLLGPAQRCGEFNVLRDHSLAFDVGAIVAIAPTASFDETWTEQGGDAGDLARAARIDGRGRLLLPGLVNTHHHLYQSLTRCVPAAANSRLFDWLTTLYGYWRNLEFHSVKLAAKVSIAELLRSGCTTTSDHFYMFPPARDVRLEAVLEAAHELGIRIHACRGAMTLGARDGGLPPDDIVETDANVLADCERVLAAFHDPDPRSLRRVDLAPCSPFNCTRDLLRETAALARSHGGVLLHTHLAETRDELAFCEEHYGCRPVEFLARHDFLGPDVYLAHCVYLNDAEIRALADTRTAVAHAPASNCRLGSGLAPVEELLRADVRVGLAVDGASSNDGGDLLAETKLALLAARLRTALHDDSEQAPLMPASTALWLATRGGADLLNRDKLGRLEVGAAADLAIFREDDVALAGAVVHDPVAALVLCNPRPERVFVAGCEVVTDYHLATADAAGLAREMNAVVANRFARRS